MDATPVNEEELFCCLTPLLVTVPTPVSDDVLPARYVGEAVTLATPDKDVDG